MLLLGSGVLAGAELSCAAAPPVPFVFVDRELGYRPIRGFAIDGERLVLWPEATEVGRGAPLSVPREECLFIVAEGSIGVASSRGGGVLEYADGRRVPGSPRLLDGAIVWRHRWLGERPLDIESLRSIILAPSVAASADAPSTARGDEVLLVNGDRIEGIVQSIGSVVAIERLEGGTFELPFERVARITLIAPDASPDAIRGIAAPRAWIVDGTVVDGSPDLPIPDDGDGRSYAADPPTVLELSMPEESFSRPIEVVALRGFVPDRSRFIPFARLAPSELRPSGDLPRFALPAPERAGGAWPADLEPVVVRGPVRLRYRLPVEGCVFAARILPHDADPRWTDAELVLRDGGREVFRRRVVAEMESEWIRVRLSSDEFELEITEGERGPVRDALRFELGLVALPSAP
jgi:hypothetical protein